MDIKQFEAWSDGKRVLYRGDSLAILPHVTGRFTGLVTDPPYGAGILDHGDDTPAEAVDLLRQVLKLSFPLMLPGAHAAIFWGSVGLDLALDAARAAGYTYSRLLTMYNPQGNARPYLGWLARTQPILLMRVPGRRMPVWRGRSIVAIQDAMAERGLSVGKLAEALGCSVRLVYKWIRADDEAWSYPGEAHRGKLRELLGVELGPAPVEEQPKERHDLYQVERGQAETLHPCEKPLPVIRDIVSRLGACILDPFCGSGTTLEAARELDVQAVGIEIDPAHVARASERLRQQRLPFSTKLLTEPEPRLYSEPALTRCQ